MSTTDDDDDGRYEVGYGRPPVTHRFRKGQSGNPSGSKRKRGNRKAKNLKTELLDELGHRVTVTENGRRRSLLRMTALAKKIVNDALAGDAKAREQLLRHVIERLQPSDAAEDIAAPSSAEDQKTLDLMRERVIAEFLARNGANNKKDDGS
jgi:hypothetical protein